MTRKVFRDRRDAGRRLAEELDWLRGEDVVVLALPRGGVPVAAEVSAALGAPLDVLAVANVELPGEAGLAMAAVGEGGVDVVLDEVVRLAGVPRLVLAQAQQHAREALEGEVAAFREVVPDLPLAGRVALVVGDGAVTGATARAACRVARARRAERVVVAVPVAAPEVLAVLQEEADVVRALYAPAAFTGLEDWYADLAPLTAAQVRAALLAATDAPAVVDLTAVGEALTVVASPRGLAVLAGPDLGALGGALRRQGWTTLALPDLPEGEEGRERLVSATLGALEQPGCVGLRVGWVGIGPAVRTLLEAAAEPGAQVEAVVGIGGRPDLARAVLPNVAAPTLLLAGARDRRAQEHARAALSWMRCDSDLFVVPGADPGDPDPVALPAERTAGWLAHHLTAPAQV